MGADSNSGAPTNGASASGLPPVLLICDKLGYPGGLSGGMTTYFVEVLPALARAGIDVVACFLREPHPAADELRRRGIDPIFFSAGRLDPFVALKIARLVREREVGIVHAAGVKATLMARIAARLAPAHVIVHVHDLVSPGPPIGTLQRWFAQPGDFGICVSDAVRATAEHGYHLRAERLRVVANGILLENFRGLPPDTRERVRESIGVPGDAKVLAMIARMFPIKGHRSMLEMLPAVVRRCPRAVLLLAGDGPERAACESLADELQLRPHVRFLGQRADVAELLAASDVSMVPSVSEGLGLSAIESLAAGRPVVGFAVGGLPEVVTDKDSGRLVPYGDRDAFVAALVEMLEDEALLGAYQRRAFAAAERFGIGPHVERLIECYREAVQPDDVAPFKATH